MRSSLRAGKSKKVAEVQGDVGLSMSYMAIWDKNFRRVESDGHWSSDQQTQEDFDHVLV